MTTRCSAAPAPAKDPRSTTIRCISRRRIATTASCSGRVRRRRLLRVEEKAFRSARSPNSDNRSLEQHLGSAFSAGASRAFRVSSRFVGDNNFKLVFDIENLPNLLNSDWGRVTKVRSSARLTSCEADLVSAADVAANGIDGATALTGDAPRLAVSRPATACSALTSSTGPDGTPITVPKGRSTEIRLTLRYDF